MGEARPLPSCEVMVKPGSWELLCHRTELCILQFAPPHARSWALRVGRVGGGRNCEN